MPFIYFIATPTRPGKPEIGDIGDASVTVSWTKPDSDDRFPITGYVVEYKEASSSDWLTVDITGSDRYDDTSLIVPDLKENMEYRFRVASANDIGSSRFSEESDICKTKGEEFAVEVIALEYWFRHYFDEECVPLCR